MDSVLSQIHLGYAYTITLAPVACITRADRLTDQYCQDGEECCFSLCFVCIDLGRCDEKRSSCPVVVRWYLEVCSLRHIVAEMCERWFKNGDGRSTSRMGTPVEDRVAPLCMGQVRDKNHTRRNWLCQGYLEGCVVFCLRHDYQHQNYICLQLMLDKPAFSRLEGVSPSSSSSSTARLRLPEEIGLVSATHHTLGYIDSIDSPGD